LFSLAFFGSEKRIKSAILHTGILSSNSSSSFSGDANKLDVVAPTTTREQISPKEEGEKKELSTIASFLLSQPQGSSSSPSTSSSVLLGKTEAFSESPSSSDRRTSHLFTTSDVLTAFQSSDPKDNVPTADLN
jgi:hypothetical protein